MQPLRLLIHRLSTLASPERYLFTLHDLRAALPGLSDNAFTTLVSRAVRSGHLERVCRGIYLYPGVNYPAGLVLYHTAARLRAGTFNYLSLESVLSDAGVISQVPIGWITLMSAGRSNVIRCGGRGTIEFVHTTKTPDSVADQLDYDARCRLWRASVPLALADMRATRRNMDLVARSMIDESV